MIARIFFFLIGFGLTVIGMVYVISYLNLLVLGYTFLEYIQFIMKRIECLYTIIGIVIMTLDICLPGGNHELYL